MSETTGHYVLESELPTGELPPFRFDGGAGSYLGVAIAGALITIVTLGFGFPFATVMRERWKASHTYVEGRQLRFTGTGFGLLGRWIVWQLLVIVTLGIYMFWLGPALTRWKVEHTTFDS
jgi:uncharacterized membrane protein YjgN (DUF898 family)